MIIKITKVTDWVSRNRKIKVGDKLQVQGQSRDSTGKKCYLVSDKENKAIVFYESEFEITKN